MSEISLTHQSFSLVLAEEERKDTRLLLGLSLDARARYLASFRRFTGACRDYRHALQICQEEQGEAHPQVQQPEYNMDWDWVMFAHIFLKLKWGKGLKTATLLLAQHL